MMNKTLEILRYEIVSAFKRPSYLLLAFGIPIFAVIAVLVFSFVKSNQSRSAISESDQNNVSLKTEGYMDYSGIIEGIPKDLPENILISFSNESEAQSALNSGKIAGYYIIPADYIESGKLIYIHPTSNPISEGGQDWIMRWTLLVNMVDGDAKLASNVWNPASFKKRNLNLEGSNTSGGSGDCVSPGFGCESNLLLQMLPLVLMLVIYISIVSGGSYLLRLISSEKDSRVMELLILSASPHQLLTGKILSYCLLGLLQVTTWFGAVFLIFRIGGTTLNIPKGFSLPISILVWGIIFYLLGFAVYASLMAGAGALTPKLSQYTSVYFIVSIPLFVSYFFSLMLLGRPHSLLAIGLSIFPLSAPVMMITRLTVGGVPAWQPMISAVLTLVMAILIVRFIAKVFHAQILLSGQPFSVSRYFKAMMRTT
jgi:ABC-2 type transport system permease protein